jgi:hypothetical protein
VRNKKPEETRQLERPTRRWEDIKMNPKGIELESEDWIHLAQK